VLLQHLSINSIVINRKAPIFYSAEQRAEIWDRWKRGP